MKCIQTAAVNTTRFQTPSVARQCECAFSADADSSVARVCLCVLGVPQSLLSALQKMTLRVVGADILPPLQSNSSLYVH